MKFNPNNPVKISVTNASLAKSILSPKANAITFLTTSIKLSTSWLNSALEYASNDNPNDANISVTNALATGNANSSTNTVSSIARRILLIASTNT